MHDRYRKGQKIREQKRQLHNFIDKEKKKRSSWYTRDRKEYKTRDQKRQVVNFIDKEIGKDGSLLMRDRKRYRGIEWDRIFLSLSILEIEND